MLKKLIKDIEEFKKYRNRNWDSTTINCPHKVCYSNRNGLCSRRAILLTDYEGHYLKCETFDWE